MFRRTLVVSALLSVLLVPSALAADPVPADFKNAAKYCKALRESKGVEGFQAQWGKNANKKNAYGKCVSATAKAKAKAEHGEDAAEAKASAACKKQKADDPAKFAQAYKNLGQCVKASKKDD
jgi:hypothetical protein